jgi:hypothetical protein
LMKDDNASAHTGPHDPPEADYAISAERLHLEIGKLPQLKIVPIASLLLHEEADPERYRPLERRISSSGRLMHPPIAARDHGTASHILLDGVNRLEALKALGMGSVAIQEVDLDDEGLVLSTWHHVIEGLDLVTRIRNETELEPVSFEGEFSEHDFVPEFADGDACHIVGPNRTCHVLRANTSAEARLDVITRMAHLTEAAANTDRVSYTNLRDLGMHYPGFSGLICYAAFTKADVVALAGQGKRFPSGVTRFSVPKRALAVGIPLELLKTDKAGADKQAELEGMIIEKIRSKKIRFYEEPTFYFDD